MEQEAQDHGLQRAIDISSQRLRRLDIRPGPVQAAGLRLEHMHTQVVRCPFAAAFYEHGDAGRFARAYVPTLRSWTESTFAAALSSDRPAEQRSKIIDSFYAEYETLVREVPEGHGMDYVHVYMVLAKRPALPALCPARTAAPLDRVI